MKTTFRRLWQRREHDLEQRVRLLESQMYWQAAKVAELDAHAIRKQFRRVRP